jgi:hypothetical protein
MPALSFSCFTSRTVTTGRRACVAALRRDYAAHSPGKPSPEVFNQRIKHLQKDRAAGNVEQSRQVDYLKDEVAGRLCERLLVIPFFPQSLSFLCILVNRFVHCSYPIDIIITIIRTLNDRLGMFSI